MAINLLDKFEKPISERFHANSYTDGWASNEYSFEGVKTIKIMSINTVPIGDYARNAFNPEGSGEIYWSQGTSRYGTPYDITDTITELSMTQDKAFTYVIDKGEGKQQYNIKSANASLDREIREVITPYMDKYRLNKWTLEGGSVFAPSDTLTKANIAELFIDLNNMLNSQFLPEQGRVFYTTSKYIKMMKLCEEYDGLESKNARITKGHVGTFDNISVVELPNGYLPTGLVGMIIVKNALMAPMKMKEYKIHVDPPGLSGDLVEGRWMHDAFIVPKRRNCVCRVVASGSAPTDVEGGFITQVASSENDYVGIAANALKHNCTVVYTTNGADPLDEYVKNKAGVMDNAAPTATGNVKLLAVTNYEDAVSVKKSVAVNSAGADCPNGAFQMYYRVYDNSASVPDTCRWGNLHRAAFFVSASGKVNWGNEF